jgi:tetratricopeptide (TPR) repeat protein
MSESLSSISELWDFSDAAASEARFREAAAAAAETGASEYRAELLTQVARAQGLQTDFEGGHKTLEIAELLLDDTMHRAKVRFLLERGRLYNSTQNAAAAFPEFELALQLARDAGESFLAVDAAHMLAIVAPPDEQIVWNLQAMQIAESSDDRKTKGWLGSLYNNIGYAYLEQEKYDAAMGSFRKLLDFCRERGDDDFANIARWFIAKVNRLQGRIDEAISQQLELEAKAADAGKPSAYTYEELGECYLASDEDDNRRAAFQKAYELFTTDSQYAFIAKFEAGRLERIKMLSAE